LNFKERSFKVLLSLKMVKLSNLSFAAFVMFVVVEVVVGQQQQCWIQCGDQQNPATPNVARKQGPPGKRGPSGLRGVKGEKGSSGEIYSDAEKLADLNGKYNEIQRQLNLVKAHIGHCTKPAFSITSQSGTFDEVRSMCKESGGDLFTSGLQRNGDEYEGQIQALVNSHGSSTFWVGMTDISVENEFRLVSEDIFDSSYSTLMVTWSSNEPNGGRRENCVAMYKNDVTDHLYDVSCEAPYYGLCENKVKVCE